MKPAASGFPPSRRVYYVLEGMNSFATTFYFFHLFFHMERAFGYGARANLLLSAANGFLYMLAAYFAGGFGQRHGYHRALKTGFSMMGIVLWVGSSVQSETGQLAVMAVWTLGMCFTWPNLEALVSEGQPPGRLQRAVGVYNLVWAAASTSAYFLGPALSSTLGPASLFWLPALVHGMQWCVLASYERRLIFVSEAKPVDLTASEVIPVVSSEKPRAGAFLKMSWAANPFAYVALNTVAALMPGIVQQVAVPPMWQGVFCSVWFFARFAAFAVLWKWSGWHYRRGWFYAAYAGMIVGFVGVCTSRSMVWGMVSQAIFGLGVGLIYYSSLYYSMDAGDQKGEHGGLHEAAIGAGIFVGPAVGALGTWIRPGEPSSVVWAVGGLMGVGALLVLFTGRRLPPRTLQAAEVRV